MPQNLHVQYVSVRLSAESFNLASFFSCIDYPESPVDRARATSCDFYPVAFETYGRLGSDSASILAKLAVRAAQDLGLHPSVEIRRWREILGLRLQLENADMLARG